MELEMPVKMIVSYDGTHNEDDAIALGRLFADAGAEIALAYVRHTHEEDASAEILAQHEAEKLLVRGAELFGGPDVARHVVTDRSTPEGLSALAERIEADAIAFCSDSHTARGHIGVGNSAQRLLQGGAAAIAIAPAGFASYEHPHLRRVLVAGDGSAHATAEQLARALGGELTSISDGSTSVLVVGSRPEAQPGCVSLSAATEHLVEVASCPVLVVPRGKTLAFEAASAVTAA
jgi:nucleotide-binding universal stress UspA family protein